MRRLILAIAAAECVLWSVVVLEGVIYRLAYSDALERIVVRVGVRW